MKRYFLYINTILKLGIPNVLYIAWYRFTIKIGLRKFLFKEEKTKFEGDFFKPLTIEKTNYPKEWKNKLIEEADKILEGNICYYSFHWKNIGNPPDWFLNPFNGERFPNVNLHWTNLSDFNPKVGDIKNIWEASRFEWLVTLSRAYAVTNNNKYLNQINIWLNDWIIKNPLNVGPNWKCGQEASFRLFNLLNSALILNQDNTPSESLKELIYFHLKRISPNIRYAIAQDNNHGTSEATALYIGGLWLANQSLTKWPKAKQYSDIGRKWLENRVEKLIAEDGSFSQHSVTYHRVLLDTLIYAEYWRQKLNDKSFSNVFYLKTNSAINWLWQLTDETSANAPNLGPNDGAKILNIHSCDYRDFRPTLQTASTIFNRCRIFPSGDYDEPLYWLSIKPIETVNNKRDSFLFKNGYVVIKAKESWSLLRFPFFKFRPTHNDVLHFDLWHKGKNIICDSGSYSYFPLENEKNLELGSVHHHNTVSFDDQEQMPKISRFLMGNWLKAEKINPLENDSNGMITFSASIVDSNKNCHERTVRNKNNEWIIEDKLSGDFKKAIIGFNINDKNCVLNNNILEVGFGRIIIPDNSIPQFTESFVSEYYYEKHLIKRLTCTVNKSGTYITRIILN